MKHASLLFLFLLFCCFGLRAQVLNDSTVQVVAYWDKGETFEFEYVQSKYKVVKGDTIFGDFLSETFELAVVDSTAEGYTLRYTTLESKAEYKDSLTQAITEKVRAALHNIPVYFTTLSLILWILQ